MSVLMISLDKKILEPHSLVAKRMVVHAQNEPLFILIPSNSDVYNVIGGNIRVVGIGGNKFKQFFTLLKKGNELIVNNKIQRITCQDPFATALIGWILKLKNNVELEIQVHGDFWGGDYYLRSGVKNFLYYFLGKFLIKRADFIRVAGLRIKKTLLVLGILETKIIIKPVVIDFKSLKNYEPKINLHNKYPSYKKIFLFLGRLDPIKNLLQLVEVFSLFSKEENYLLLIVGEGFQRKIIEKKITELNLSNNVKMEGWTNDPWSYLKTCDCLVLPSLSEGYGVVVMEAAAVNVTIIMTDVGVANYELLPSDKVFICPVNNKIALKTAIENV